jgi:nucleotide-binding universal stress UspA family protein
MSSRSPTAWSSGRPTGLHVRYADTSRRCARHECGRAATATGSRRPREGRPTASTGTHSAGRPGSPDVEHDRSAPRRPGWVVFNKLLAVCPPPPGDACIHPVAAAIARLTGSGLVSTCRRSAVSDADGLIRDTARDTGPRRVGRELKLPTGRPLDVIPRAARAEGADLVAIAVSAGGESDLAAQLARTLLDAGIAVLAVPRSADRRLQLRRLGIGHDGSRPAAAALAVARRIAEAGGGQIARLDIAYVDDSASSACEVDGDVVASHREAAIEWWLAELAEQVPAPVRPLGRVGDPAGQLAELSHDLDLLVIGTRGRAPLRRALTGSESRRLIATARCPLLIVPPRAAAAMVGM